MAKSLLGEFSAIDQVGAGMEPMIVITARTVLSCELPTKPRINTMAQLYIRNAKKIECASSFPPTAVSVKVKISKIVPKDSAVLIYTPPLQDKPIQFNGPETIADVPVAGYEIYAQAVLGCRGFQLDFLGWKDKI